MFSLQTDLRNPTSNQQYKIQWNNFIRHLVEYNFWDFWDYHILDYVEYDSVSDDYIFRVS